MLKPYFRTLLILALINLVGMALAPAIGYRAVGFVFLIGVLGVGFVASIGPVLFSALLSAIAWNVFFIPPRFTFQISHPDDIFLCLTYFVAALITGVLTNRVRDREERLRQAEMLKESEKLHQTLLNSISHELRTPLTAIMGSATALSDAHSPDTPEFRQALASELTHATDRLNRVIENLLDMSRINSGVITLKKEWHDIHDLIGVTLQRLGKNLDGFSVEIETSDTLPLVEIDFRLMEHVLSNLLMNAIQYSPRGSKIKISAAAKFGKAILIVEDQGPGIDADKLSKVFEKFYRVPGTPTGGTGLGLSIAKSIVELHHGTIAAENRSEGGARFVTILPRGTPPDMPKEQDA